MVETVKIFGERNTSTNALKAVIEQNSRSWVAPSVVTELDPDFSRRLRRARKLRMPHWVQERMIDRVFRTTDPLRSWKHAATNFDDLRAFAGCHVVFCVRHPASWILGLYRRPYQIAGASGNSLDEFLNKRWRTVARERLGRRMVTATQLYNLKMASYKDMQARLDAAGMPFSVVRQEDFAIDQSKVFDALAPHLSGPHVDFQELEASTKDSRKDKDYYREYYGQQRWLKEIDSAYRARIREEIDWALVADLDYMPV